MTLFRLHHGDVGAREHAVDSIIALPLDIDWQVTVEKRKKKRTLSQNALIHKWFAIVAEYTGDTEAGVKSDLVEACAPTVESKVTGEMRAKSTSEMTTQEMSDFIDHLYVFITNEIGCRIPMPQEAHKLW